MFYIPFFILLLFFFLIYIFPFSLFFFPNQLSELVTAPTSSDTSAYRVASQKKLKRKTKKGELGLPFLLCLLSFFTQPVANNAKCCVPVWIFACIAYLDESVALRNFFPAFIVSLTIVSRCRKNSRILYILHVIAAKRLANYIERSIILKYS